MNKLIAQSEILPAITLYQPWATWIMREWKTIETRTHNRFRGFVGKRILIHAGMNTDNEAKNCPYLTKEQLMYKPDEMINGYILGSVFVYSFGKLSRPIHSQLALIDCENFERFGLHLSNADKFDKPIPCKGQMGIWYYDIANQKTVSKAKHNTRTLFNN